MLALLGVQACEILARCAACASVLASRVSLRQLDSKLWSPTIDFPSGNRRGSGLWLSGGVTVL